MGKHDFLTPKAISNRMKAKGLQRLRWFCQVCQKQCRDENGFKCHTSSESHQRQMMIVAHNPNKFLSGYSQMFESAFLANLRQRHGTKRMLANVVYNEYISDKLHVHMNATKWTTLASFVQYLGRTSKCVVDETEKGWYIQYIDRDPRAVARQEELEKKKKADLDHEERNRAFIQRQYKLAREANGDCEQNEVLRPTKLQRADVDEKITISLGAKISKEKSSKVKPNVFARVSVADETKERNSSIRPKRAVDAIMEENERRKLKRKRSSEERCNIVEENWITKGIIVKVMNKSVGDGKYYKQKGEVIDVQDCFAAQVKMLDNGDVLKLDQDDLETVIPKIGRHVRIVNGIGRGQIATLLSISIDDYCACIRVESGSRRGDKLERVNYEYICKLANEATDIDKR